MSTAELQQTCPQENHSVLLNLFNLAFLLSGREPSQLMASCSLFKITGAGTMASQAQFLKMYCKASWTVNPILDLDFDSITQWKFWEEHIVSAFHSDGARAFGHTSFSCGLFLLRILSLIPYFCIIGQHQRLQRQMLLGHQLLVNSLQLGTHSRKYSSFIRVQIKLASENSLHP